MSDVNSLVPCGVSRRGLRLGLVLATAAVVIPYGGAAAQVMDGGTPAATDNLQADDIVPPEGVGTAPVLSDPPPAAPDVYEDALRAAPTRSASEGDILSIDPDRPSVILEGSSPQSEAADDGLAGAAPRSMSEEYDVAPVGSLAVPRGEAGFEAAETTLYGPPSPKVRSGELAAVGWTEPTEHVPPALEEAVNLVTRNYPSATAARAALRAAASDVRAAKWLKFPSFNANLAYLDDSGSPEPQLVVEAPIWAGGRIRANVRRAQAVEDASSAGYVETLQDLAVTTSQTYFEIVRLTQREQLLADSVEEHLRLVGTMENRVSQEISPLADLELARSRTAQIEQEYNITRSQRRTALRVLAELVADPAYDLGPVPFYDETEDLIDRSALEEQAVAFDPTLDRLRAETDIARADLDTREASILPQLNAQYSYDEIFGSRVGLVVRSQTSGGLSQFSEINSARLRITSALDNRRVAEQQLRRDVQADIILYEAAKDRATISESAASSAARVSASYVRQFIAGRRSWLDVMNALREAVTAQIGRADAEVTAMAAASRLLLLSGRWRPVFVEPER